MLATPTQRTNLPAVRRLEAVGFRAWPSAFVLYDGSWQIRLTRGHGSKRLNCIVPLDPSDHKDIADRLARAAVRFKAEGQRLTVRETPLAPPLLIDHLRQQGWHRFETVAVMTVDIDSASLPDTIDHVPSQDAERFAHACTALETSGAMEAGAILDILGRIRPAAGYFLIDDVERGPRACLLCVQDNDLAGIQSLAVAGDARRSGLGTELVSAALRWARLRGAKTAWLQVSSENVAALSLYERLGFSVAYHYHYWRPQSDDSTR